MSIATSHSSKPSCFKPRFAILIARVSCCDGNTNGSIGHQTVARHRSSAAKVGRSILSPHVGDTTSAIAISNFSISATTAMKHHQVRCAVFLLGHTVVSGTRPSANVSTSSSTVTCSTTVRRDFVRFVCDARLGRLLFFRRYAQSADHN